MELLREGKISNQDLATWFGCAAKTLRNGKQEKLEELREYAEFYEDKGKVVITKVLNAGPYIKKKSKAYRIIKGAFNETWSDSGLDTCSRVSEQIYKEHKDELAIAETTTYNYTLATRTELYGRPFLGNCYYLWCKKSFDENGEQILIPFTEEEQEIKKVLMKKHFATNEEKDVMIAEMVKAGEISKEEAYDLSCEMRGLNEKGFMAFKAELEEKLGCSIVKGTMIEKGNYVDFKQLDAGKE